MPGSSAGTQQTGGWLQELLRAGLPETRFKKSLMGGTAGADLLGGEAVERRGGDTEDAEVDVELAAVVGLVLDHGAEPVGNADFASSGRFALALQILIGQLRENLHGLGVEAFHECQNVFVAVREIFAVVGVAALVSLNVFRPHVAFSDGEMAKDVAKGEFARGIGPVNFVGRYAARDAYGALADVVEVFQEWFDGADFHGGLVQRQEELEQFNAMADS